LGHLGHAPFELQKNLAYGQYATLEKLPQWKITKIVATRCQILRLKCPNSISAWVPCKTLLGSLQLDLRSPTSKGRERKGIEERKEGKGKGGLWRGMGEEGREKKGRGKEEMDAKFPEYATLLFVIK